MAYVMNLTGSKVPNQGLGHNVFVYLSLRAEIMGAWCAGS